MTPDPDAQARNALAEAQRLAEAGYALTPVTITRAPSGKKHAQFHKGWRHEDAWSRDPDQIRAWWVDHPEASFAIGCAVNGIEGVDLDVKPDEGVDAVTWWAEQGHPLGSLVQTTPSGGLHNIWRVRDDGLALPQEAGKTFGRGVDTRNRAGLFFAAGAYVVGEPGSYAVLGELPLLDRALSTPSEVIELFAEHGAQQRTQRPTDGRIVYHDQAWQELMVAQALEAVRAHDRDAGGYRRKLQHAGLFYGRAVEQGFLTFDEAEQRILEAHQAVWGPETWPENVKDIRDALRDGPALERWRVPDPTSASGSSDAEPELLNGGLLPREVWDRSAVLNHIYRAAMATLTCPDAVLYSVLVIIASYLHHGSRVETGVRPSVLSYYLAAIGASGGGKSEALSVARDLLERWCADRFAISGAEGYYDGPVGSGEGLVEAFMGEVRVQVIDPETKEPKRDDRGEVETKKGRGQARHNALFHSDEGRQVLAIDSRKGATVLAVLCEMWSGSVAGQTNADKDRTRRLGRGTYVLGLLLGFQPATIDALFDDAAGGAPQRFAFAPVAYPPHAESDETVEWPGDLMPVVPVMPVRVELKAEHRAEVRTHRRLKAAGKVDEANPLDGHRMLLRVRTAALLTLLHGVTAVDDELWELSGLMVDRSCALRDHLAGQAQRRAKELRQARQDEAVETHVRATGADASRARVQRAADSLVRFLEKHGETPRGTALNGISRSVRHLSAEAERKLINEGVIQVQDGRLILS